MWLVEKENSKITEDKQENYPLQIEKRNKYKFYGMGAAVVFFFWRNLYLQSYVDCLFRFISNERKLRNQRKSKVFSVLVA